MLFRLKGNWPLSGQTLKLGKSTYLNVATAQVTDNPAMADGSSIHQEAKQQLHSYLRSNIQPLMQTGKSLDLKEIMHRVTIRKPKLVQQLGKQQVQHMVQMLLDQ